MSYLIDNIFIRFSEVVFRQTVCIPMGTIIVLLLLQAFLYSYENGFMFGISHDMQSDVIDSFNDTSWYMDDIFNIDNPFFAWMVSAIYPPELTFNKANESDTVVSFLDLSIFSLT